MSATNGNRSRFNIARKRRIARRMQTRALITQLAETPAPQEAPKKAAAKKTKKAEPAADEA
jgi:hypothetical protein